MSYLLRILFITFQTSLQLFSDFRILFKKKKILFNFQLKKEQFNDIKLKAIIEILSGKRKETFKKCKIQNYVMHDDFLYYRKSVLRCGIT